MASVIIAAAAMGAMGVAAPAMAAYEACSTTQFMPIGKRKCSTASVKSNRAHDIRVVVYACKGSPYRVWDTGTGKTVASGKGKGQDVVVDRVINGLYGTYRAQLTDACRHDKIALQDY